MDPRGQLLVSSISSWIRLIGEGFRLCDIILDLLLLERKCPSEPQQPQETSGLLDRQLLQ